MKLILKKQPYLKFYQDWSGSELVKTRTKRRYLRRKKIDYHISKTSTLKRPKTCIVS